MGDLGSNYIGVILEEIRDQNKAVLESVGQMQTQVARLPKIEEDVTELKQDTKIIKAAITDLSHQVVDHEHRITASEQAT